MKTPHSNDKSSHLNTSPAAQSFFRRHPSLTLNLIMALCAVVATVLAFWLIWFSSHLTATDRDITDTCLMIPFFSAFCAVVLQRHPKCSPILKIVFYVIGVVYMGMMGVLAGKISSRIAIGLTMIIACTIYAIISIAAMIYMTKKPRLSRSINN